MRQWPAYRQVGLVAAPVAAADEEPQRRVLSRSMAGLKPGGSREAIDPPLYPRCDLIDYLAQALSAFKAASAEAFVVWAAPTTFMLLPVAGWLSTI